jgi:hypothetical protein
MDTHATLPKLAGNLLNGKNRDLLEVLYDAPICMYKELSQKLVTECSNTERHPVKNNLSRNSTV